MPICLLFSTCQPGNTQISVQTARGVPPCQRFPTDLRRRKPSSEIGRWGKKCRLIRKSNLAGYWEGGARRTVLHGSKTRLHFVWRSNRAFADNPAHTRQEAGYAGEDSDMLLDGGPGGLAGDDDHVPAVVLGLVERLVSLDDEIVVGGECPALDGCHTDGCRD